MPTCALFILLSNRYHFVVFASEADLLGVIDRVPSVELVDAVDERLAIVSFRRLDGINQIKTGIIERDGVGRCQDAISCISGSCGCASQSQSIEILFMTLM